MKVKRIARRNVIFMVDGDSESDNVRKRTYRRPLRPGLSLIMRRIPLPINDRLITAGTAATDTRGIRIPF
jgi:hypothetical protein